MARMVPDRLPRRRYPCRFCGVSFAALLVTQAPDGAVLLTTCRRCTATGWAIPAPRMEAGEDIATVAAEAYES